MSVEEEAEAVSQIFELGRGHAFLRPGHLLQRAGPRQGFEDRQARFQERTVEARIVRNHQFHPVQQGSHPRIVDALAGHHVIGNAMHRGRRRRYRPARIFQFVEDVQYPVDLPAFPVEFEHHHGKFNDRIHFQRQSGGFRIHHHATGQRPAVRLGIAAALGQPAQDAVIGMAFQLLRQALDIDGGEKIGFGHTVGR